MKTILAAPNLLTIEKITLHHDKVQIIVKTKPLKSGCPSWDLQSDKAHSRYKRLFADLPWGRIAVKLILSVRKFFCLNPDCRRRIFYERLPGLAAPYAHRMLRLDELITSLGLAMDSRPGGGLARDGNTDRP